MSPTPVVRVISLVSALYLYREYILSTVLREHRPGRTHLFSWRSISSATCGNGLAAFFAQKKSFESRSYVFFCSRPASGACPPCQTSRQFAFLVSRSKTHLYSNPIQPHPQYIVHERLIRPAVADHRHQIDVPVQDDEHCVSVDLRQFFDSRVRAEDVN
jgi:hypothetical protein